MSTRKLGAAGIAHYFINSKLTPLVMVFAILLGAFAVLETPREEEPQIIVPMMDVLVQMPGSTAQEVEQRVTTPMEKLIWEIPGVEYVILIMLPASAWPSCASRWVKRRRFHHQALQQALFAL